MSAQYPLSLVHAIDIRPHSSKFHFTNWDFPFSIYISLFNSLTSSDSIPQWRVTTIYKIYPQFKVKPIFCALPRESTSKCTLPCESQSSARKWRLIRRCDCHMWWGVICLIKPITRGATLADRPADRSWTLGVGSGREEGVSHVDHLPPSARVL